MLFIKIIMFCLFLIKCIVWFKINLVICVWFCGCWLKVEEIILFLMFCFKLVIFLGCLLINNRINFILGWFFVILLVIFFKIFVFLVFGGVIIKLCCLKLIGVNILIICVDNLLVVVFNVNCFLGYNGVSVGKCGCFFVFLGFFLLIFLICMSL